MVHKTHSITSTTGHSLRQPEAVPHPRSTGKNPHPEPARNARTKTDRTGIGAHGLAGPGYAQVLAPDTPKSLLSRYRWPGRVPTQEPSERARARNQKLSQSSSPPFAAAFGAGAADCATAGAAGGANRAAAEALGALAAAFLAVAGLLPSVAWAAGAGRGAGAGAALGAAADALVVTAPTLNTDTTCARCCAWSRIEAAAAVDSSTSAAFCCVI